MARPPSYLEKARPDVIDINMGCPAPKIAGTPAAVLLMRSGVSCFGDRRGGMRCGAGAGDG